MLQLLRSVVASLGCAVALVGQDDRVADLVLVGGEIVTVDDALGTVEALAVRGDRIAAVGTRAEIERWVGEGTRVVDLAGATRRIWGGIWGNIWRNLWLYGEVYGEGYGDGTLFGSLGPIWDP